ncbi:hypothetical protein Leryth_024004 [Lithospermum erythrorhizon]|nr:hypothetical protein Leryth_024004 [Lithospermum erythrorhizon]
MSRPMVSKLTEGVVHGKNHYVHFLRSHAMTEGFLTSQHFASKPMNISFTFYFWLERMIEI